MKIRILHVDNEVLRLALCLPDDVSIQGINSDFDAYGSLRIRLVSERFGEVRGGDLIPTVNADFELVDGKPQFVAFR